MQVVSCELAHIGGWGLGVTGSSRFVTLSKSTLFDSAIGGVYYDGCGGCKTPGSSGCHDSDGKLLYSANHTLTHNKIADGGHVIPQGVGVHIS